MSKAETDPVNPECNCSALRQAARCITRFYDEALAPVGLGANQYAVLAKLERFGPHCLGDLAERLVMDRSSVGHLLRPLERRDLVTVSVGKTDGRKRVVALSAAGRAAEADARPLWAAAQARFERDFGPDQARSMRAMLIRVVAPERQDASASVQELTR